MLKAVRSLMTIVFIAMRGKTTVESKPTGVDYRCHLDVSNRSSNIRTIYLICKEYVHTTKYGNWLMPDCKNYVYCVEVVRINNSHCESSPIAWYPLLCSKLIPNKTYPHRCAINAHLDQLIASSN